LEPARRHATLELVFDEPPFPLRRTELE